jgi:hypothetical protein
LFTYTFRLTEDAIIETMGAVTEPITLEFANAFGSNPPYDVNGNPLEVTMPQTIGRVAIGDIYYRNQEFPVTFALSGGETVSAAMIRVGIPAGLELIGFEVRNQSLLRDGGAFEGPVGWNRTTNVVSPIIQGTSLSGAANTFVYAGWAGSDVTLNGGLFTFLFRVRSNAALGALEIPFAFANAVNPQPPVDANGDPVNVTLPGNRRITIGTR